jgi:hypothetical protein
MQSESVRASLALVATDWIFMRNKLIFITNFLQHEPLVNCAFY